ncbi:MAG TPA: type II toxin-antitoxin system Phd/YefM family antitoxin [Caldithrix sp.]|nr:type II toxin-antitoxin system Phd/YefM family antitoxin [Caldithrix sp.]
METLDIKNIRPLTDFRNNIKKYIKELNTNKKPIVLTQHGKSAAVLLNAEKYQEMQDQIEFMRKILLGLEDYQHNRVHTASEVFSEIDEIIARSKNL